ncbi:MAG: hypothetical protein NVS3B20_08480 [Polyangiales bacterium]
MGLRVESVWLRESPREFGIGPYAEMRTASFAYGEYGGGVVAVLPTDMTFPLWAGAGGFARREEGAWGGGANAFVAFGSRSFNYTSCYGMAFGVIGDVRWHAAPVQGIDLVLAASLDLEAIALPFTLLIGALRGRR